MNYDVYKNVRNASWQCLIDCQISELPTKLSKICKHFNITVLRNSTLKENKLSTNQRGKTLYLDGLCYIIIDDRESIQSQRYTIAHELGHFVLGSYLSEYEAERFAIGILAPACVLNALHLTDPSDIARVCNISITAATNRSKRMKILNQRNMFLRHPLECKVFEQFNPYIFNGK